MFVSDILKGKGGNVVSLTSEQPVAEALALMAQHRIGAVLVLDAGGVIAGILAERSGPGYAQARQGGVRQAGGRPDDDAGGDLLTQRTRSAPSRA